MEASELESSVNIVFEKEIQDLDRGHQTFTVSESNGKDVIHYQNAEALEQLFLTIRNNPKLHSIFIDKLEEGIIKSESSHYISYGVYLGISALCFYTLVNVGHANEAITALKRRRKWPGGIYRLIIKLLPGNYFNDVQQEEILVKIREDKDQSDEARALESKLIESRYHLLTRQIFKMNIEINQDKKDVSKKIHQFGFDPSYDTLLEEIDSFINNETSEVLNAGMINTLRAFMEDLMKGVGKKISEKSNEEIPPLKGHGEMGKVRVYLKIKLGLSSEDDRFIDSFVNILHSEGGHAFMSEKEYFRLARNIAIEIALFLLSKYEKKFS